MDKDKIFRIIIADDHEIVRSGLKLLLKPQKGLEIVDEAASYSELSFLLQDNSYDLLILDLNLGDKNGVESIVEISDKYKDLLILVLSMYPEETYALQSIKSGASGYLNKKVISTKLIKVIQKILAGEKYISEALNSKLLYGETLNKDKQNPLELLSKRENQVLSLIASGISYKDIAKKLSLSQKTISTYRSRILDKLSLSNTNQLIHFALQHHLNI